MDADTEGLDRLAQMLEMQDKFEELAVGCRFSTLLQGGEEAVIFQFKEMKLALESELQEALDEMGWKPWATSHHFNAGAVRSEVIDAWHFLMCMWLLAGGTADMFYEEYLRKITVNIDRQTRASGYDGLSDKCQKCHRALDDPTTECRPPGYFKGGNHAMLDGNLVGTSRVAFCAHGEGNYLWAS